MYMDLQIIHIEILIGNPTNGATTGPHLHFTIKVGQKYINPMSLF